LPPGNFRRSSCLEVLILFTGIGCDFGSAPSGSSRTHSTPIFPQPPIASPRSGAPARCAPTSQLTQGRPSAHVSGWNFRMELQVRVALFLDTGRCGVEIRATKRDSKHGEVVEDAMTEIRSMAFIPMAGVRHLPLPALRGDDCFEFSSPQESNAGCKMRSRGMFISFGIVTRTSGSAPPSSAIPPAIESLWTPKTTKRTLSFTE
jgi:hypothetical protein